MAVSFQVIQVNETTPCFLNYSAGVEIWRNCGLGDDYIEMVLLPWEWITGGYFTMVIVSIFSMFSYIKYKNVIYPMMIGIIFLPISYFVFPVPFLSFVLLMFGLAIGILVWYAYIKQTKEY